MAFKLGGWCVVLDCANANELAAFYEKLLGWTVIEGEEFATVANLGQSGPPMWITFQSVEGYVPPVWPMAPGKQQQMEHMDFHVEDMEAGVQHALACGATMSNVQLEDDWRVLLDPAGHPFCVLPIPNWMKEWPG